MPEPSVDKEQKASSELAKNIMNMSNKTFERKGKLYKKGLNSDKFKERLFVLYKYHLFYYKQEKTKGGRNFLISISLYNAHIQVLDPKSLKLQKGTNFKGMFELENETRKYVLCTKSQEDLDFWFYAISSQIRLLRDNKSLSELSKCVVQKEIEISKVDKNIVNKLLKPNNILFDPIQPMLLDFLGDPIIGELLPNITKYMSLTKDVNLMKHAIEKANEIIQQLKILYAKASKSSFKEESREDHLKQGQANSMMSQIDGVVPEYRRYKKLRPEQKILCLIGVEELDQVNACYQRMQSELDKMGPAITTVEQIKEIHSKAVEPKLFNLILTKIQRVLKHNYLDEFFKKMYVLPTQEHRNYLPDLSFSCCTDQRQPFNQKNKQVNIFGIMAAKRQGSNNSLADPQRTPQKDRNKTVTNKTKLAQAGQVNGMSKSTINNNDDQQMSFDNPQQVMKQNTVVKVKDNQ